MMKKAMSEAQFAEVIRTLNIEQQTIMIARGVLVEGKRQKHFVSELGLTPGAISQAVKRVWEAFQEKAAVPPGHERVTVILPAHQAFIAKKWEHQAQTARKPGI